MPWTTSIASLLVAQCALLQAGDLKQEPTRGAPLPKAKPTITQRGAAGINQPVVLDFGDRAAEPQRVVPSIPSDSELARVVVPGDLVKMVRLFDSDSYAERAAARDQIAARKPSSKELMAILMRSDLSTEARHVILSILETSILNEPRGALGIRMDVALARQTGVRVSGLVAGMPAERVLQVGDVIREVGGRRLFDGGDLVRAVQSMPPGLEVEMLVRRTLRDAEGRALVGADGLERTEDLSLKVRLGSADDLDQRDGAQGGRVANAVAEERQAQVEEARKRFLPQPRQVEFAKRELHAARAANPETLRKQLVAMQLTGVDPDWIRERRERLDGLERAIAAATDDAVRRPLLEQLETLAGEIRARH